MTKDEALKLALESLESGKNHGIAIDVLRRVLAEQPAQQQKPVAWRNAAIRVGEDLSSVGPDGYYEMTADQWLDWAMAQEPRGKTSLNAPPVSKPLTDEQIMEMYNEPRSDAEMLEFARAIEAAHGIKGDA